MTVDVVATFEKLGVFPIIVINNVEDAVPLGEALLEAGMPIAEITFRTPAAAASIENLARALPEMLLGAGTVLSPEQARQASDAGARFVLSPGFNPVVVDYCRENEIAIFPGVCTPTEIEGALARGLDVLKFFPAEAMGGLNYLKAVCAPLSMVRFLPTGGLNPENLPGYVAFKQTLACAGTWIVRREWLEERRFDLIRGAAEHALEIVTATRESAHA